ncbi:MAG: FtsX-like permease family protein [Bacteroidetes bacterium]|nr:FtsX-like permease family protein [Bacteroidota bacterium]
MNFPFYISKRYLVAKKSKNVINVISLISVIGVTVGTAALIIVLSAFNGLDSLLKSMNDSFDPDLKILPASGKVFSLNDSNLEKIKNHDAVFEISEVLEEKALLKYDDQQYPATVKGVCDNYRNVTGVDSMLYVGDFILKHNNQPYAIVGQGVAYFLSLNLNYIDPIVIYVPKRNAEIGLNPERAFNRNYIFPSAIFAIQQEFDTKYIIVPLDYARKLFEYDKEVSALEIKLKEGYNSEKTQHEFQEILGSDYEVKNRYQLHEAFYKIMKSEKFYIFLILIFILIVASFNIIGSLTMLIIDKKEDIATFRSLGANLKTIRRIFLTEGWLITIVGAVFGLILGYIVCWIQIQFEPIKLGSSGSFIVDAYPIKLIWSDFILIFLTVVSIGYFAAWYPVRYITKRFVIQEVDG